jgi:dTDP-4-dehydrorhamnose 3,5-epimerase
MSSQFRIKQEIFPNTFLLESNMHVDERGSFLKLYNENAFKELGLAFDYKEEYVSRSKKNVIRGMHFQIPPYSHDKMVWCSRGSVTDVLLDIRKGNYYGHSKSITLTEDDNLIIYIPSGIAHGFKSLQDNSELVYKTSSTHMAEYDRGILWNSFDFDWKLDKDPIISTRDTNHPTIQSFDSPF